MLAKRSNRLAVLLAAAAAALAVAGCTSGAVDQPTAAPTPPSAAATPVPTSEQLQSAVTVEGIRTHLEELQQIAEDNGGNRAAGTPGYDASADYVSEVLTAAGYRVSRQPFDITKYEERSPPRLQAAALREQPRSGVDFAAMEFSPSGDVSGPLAVVDLRLPPGTTASTSGCQREDFAGFPDGAVALLQRGTCPYLDKVRNAEAAGAVAALVFNEGQPGRRGLEPASLGAPRVGIPALSLSFAAGERLAEAEGEEVQVQTDTVSTAQPTSNVIAETPGGDPDQVVMVGAHLDSVPEGPGINDNGSGVATILEIARAMAAQTPGSKVRFAFWGGEELGLLGSQHYAAQLPAEDVRRIAAYVNFDMVGSPNFTRYVYGTAGAPPGSDVIAQVFEDYFAERDLPVTTIDLGGRSDHAAFVELDIPVGGLFTGAENREESDAAGEPGGVGQPNDPCYHAACDDLGNVDDDALDQLGDAAAHAVVTLAADTAALEQARAD